ncbi:MAG: VOC family protein [Alphaproteobacteria bacterium]|nr:VOC family protein [Alphaproteobacteria bacterium]
MSLSAAAKAVTFILTRDRDRAMAYYSDVLGLRVAHVDDFAVVYDVGGAIMRLTTIPDHTPGPHPVLGWMVDDIAATMTALRAKGVTFNIYDGFGQDAEGVWTAPGGAAKVSWFNDPDGNLLSLTQS